MPNDLTAKRNLLNARPESCPESRPESRSDVRSESQRQKLASSGFTASVWTISGVVLVACGTVEDFLGLDDGGGGGGRSVHVQSSPVQGARIYFDADGDGMISDVERAAQDAFRPEGFVSDENGDVPDIPAHLYGTPFVAYLDGAFDADTDEPLSGTLHSIPDENGDHTLASPITDFIAGEVMRQAGPLTHEQLADAIDDIVERIIEIDPDADTEAAVNAFLGMVSDPTNYDGSSGVDALARYLVETNDPTEALVEAQITVLLPDPTTPIPDADTLTVTDTMLDDVTIGEHDSYIGTIEVVSHAGRVQYSFVNADGTPANVSDYIIERGVISVAEGAFANLPTGLTMLYIAVNNGRAPEVIVSVAVTVVDSASLPTLSPPASTSVEMGEDTAGGTDLITGISVTDATNPVWVIRTPDADGLASKFEIVEASGAFNLALKAGESLDFEALSRLPDSTITLQVQAKDSVTGVSSERLELTITVTPANDAPVFLNAVLNPDLNYAPEIAETTAIGTEIARVEARDADGDSVTYAITGGTGMGVFDIDSGTGAITLQSALDYDTSPTPTETYTLTITATDSLDADGAPDTTADATETVTITVTDINDESPTVAPTAGTGTVRIMSAADNTAGTGTGYTITVTDADANNDFNVSITGDPRFDFRRQTNTNTWELFLDTDQAVADSELNNQITLTYTVTDGGVGTIAARGTVMLTVVDTPVSFTSPATAAARTINLAEDTGTSPTTAHFMVQARSDDGAGTRVDIARYELLDENMAVVSEYKGFQIDATSGDITLRSSLDYEMDETITLRVRATDDNDETNTLMLTVNVDDVNEHAPAFAQSAYTATISESRTAAEGSFLEITATDADGTNDVVTYSITAGDPDDLFFIDPNSGALRVADGATLNYDTTPATTGYTLTITATDSDADNPMLSTQDVIITLTDANDIVPVVTPPQSGAFRVRTTGTEDASGNAAASTGYSITIDDADTGNDFTFGLDASSRFEFRDQGSGVWELFLKAGVAVTEAKGETITVNYQVNDGENELPPSTATLSVVDTPVTFTSPSDVPLPEGSDVGYGVTTVRAESTHSNGMPADVTDFRFVVGDALMTNDQEFTISRKLGVITLSNVLDYDADGAVRVFNLVVRATDENGETNDQMLTIRLGDENDNAPVFAASTYTETVDETYAVGTEIARVSATDADGTDEYSTVTYSITAGNVALLDADDNPTGEMLFTIGSDGVITLNAPLDFETAQMHTLTIGASDGADADGMDDTVIDATATVTITLTDINDESPSVPNHAATGSARITTVADNPANGDGVSMGYVVAVTDADADATTLEVSVGGATSDRFEFRRQTGTNTWELYLKAGQVIDESVGDEISLSYTVTDGGAPLTAPVTNTFILTAVDTPVRFTPPTTAALMVDENDANWELVLVAVSDAGGGDTSDIAKYEFVNGSSTDTTFGDFSITTNNDKHGVITITRAFDFETDSTTHKLIVRATDSRDDPEIQDIEFTVTVRDLNEAPAFGQPTYTATIPEDMAVGTTVTTVTAADEDTAGTNGQVRYAITGGSGMEFFQILDPASGAITVKQALNYDTTPTATTGYTLEITATDGGDMTDTAMVDITLTGVDDETPTGQAVTAGSMGQIGEIAGSGTAPVGGKDADYRITITDLDTTSGFTFTFSGTTALEKELAPKFDFIEGNNDQWALTLKAGESLDRDDSRYPIDSTITLKYTIDDGSNNLSEEYEVDVRITDANDKAPTVVVAQVDSNVDIAVNERIEGNNAPIAVTGLTIMVDDTDATSAHQSGVGIVPTLRILNADNNTENANFGVAGFGSTGGVGTWKIQLNSGKALDYETTTTLRLKIEVSDGVNTPNMSEAFTVTVNNLDEGDATYAISGSVAEDATLTAMLVAGREDPDGVDSSVDVMYRWFRKASADLAPTSFETLETTTFKWLGAESTTNTYTITGAPVEGAQYGVLVGYKDNSVGDALSFVPVIASALKFGASSYSGSIDEDGNNITTIDIDATLDDSADDITYAFVTDADAGTTAATHLGFAIDSDGVITFTGTAATDLDYDTDPRTEQIELTVRATYDDSNNATPNPFSDVDVVVTINDLNDNPPTAKPSATTDTLAEQYFLTHLPRNTDITFTIEDVDSVGSNTVMASDFVVYAGASGTTTEDRFEVADVGGTWTLRLKANEELDYEEENADNDPTITLRVAIDDGTHTPIPSEAITITAEDRNDLGAVVITRDTATKTLTATLTDQDGILTAADGATPPSYEWFDVATGERVGTDSNTFTYTDDNAHYRVRVEYRDVWGGANLVNRAESSTASISLSRNIAFLLEHDTFPVPVSATLTSDGSAIPSNELTLAFVTEDGTTATTYKGVTIANGFVMPVIDRLNYEALTPDEQMNGIKFIIRATHDGNSVDIAFSVRVSNRNEVVSFGDEYTDYLKTINLLDGRTIATTETIHTATATADSNGAITYSLSGTDASLFMIDGTSGAVTFKAATTLDSSMKDSYEFEVIATETGTSNTERQSVTIDVSSIRFTSADTVDRTAANVNHNIDLGHNDHFVIDIVTERANNAGVTYAFTGGADMDLFTIDGLIAQGGTNKLNLRIDHQNFVKKSQYEVEITATNIVTMEPVVQMFTLTVAGYPESPPVIKLPAGTAADYTSPINIDDEDIDIITFTIEDPDKNYVAGDISVVGSDGTTADTRFMVTWDAATQTGTLQAAGTGVDFSKLSIPSGGEATDPRWTSTFIRVTDTPEGSIASGDDVRVVLRVAERSVVIGSGQDTHSINDSDVGTSGSLLVAVIANVTVEGTSATVGWAITGGEDAALFFLADRAGHGTNVRLNFGHADFVKKAEYKVKLTATNSVTEDTDDIEITLTVNNFVAPAPAITPDRTEPQVEVEIPDADPLAGIVPIPDTDPHAG